MRQSGRVVGVNSSNVHAFSKQAVAAIELRAGIGVVGDAHAGRTVKHRSRVARDPTQPNLRQVHLIHRELFEQLGQQGFDLESGALGENVTTEGIELLNLPVGAQLRLGPDALIELTGLRNPCAQIERFRPGLLKAVLPRNDAGELMRLAGVMSVVIEGGVVSAGDAIRVTVPDGAHRALAVV